MTDDSPLRLLVLMRHAEAKGHAKNGGDEARELTKTGRAAAERVGQWLADQGVRPDVVVVSPATRTLQTWEHVREAGFRPGDVWCDAAVYDAEPEDLIESVNAVPADVGTLLLIGHAPGIPRLVGALPDHTDLPDGRRTDMVSWPPAAIAVVCHRGAWSEFPTEDSAVAAFHLP